MTFWIDWVWTLIAAIGLGLSAYTWRDARLDIKARRRLHRNGTLLLVARMSARQSAGFVVIFLMLGLLGVLVLANYRPPRAPVASAIESVVLIVMELVLVAVKALNLRDRLSLRSGDH